MAEQPRRYTSAFGSGDLRLRLGNERVDLRKSSLDLRSHAGLGIGGIARRVLRVFTTFECVIQRQAVVAGGDGLVSVLERRRRRVVFRFGVLVGACGARGIDGALCLIHFLVGRLRASGKETNGEGPYTCRSAAPEHRN